MASFTAPEPVVPHTAILLTLLLTVVRRPLILKDSQTKLHFKNFLCYFLKEPSVSLKWRQKRYCSLSVWLLIGNASWFSGLRRKDWKWESDKDWVKAFFSCSPTHLFHLPYHCTDSFSILSLPWSCNILWMAGIGDGSLALTYSTRAISWASEVLNCLLNTIWQL